MVTPTTIGHYFPPRNLFFNGNYKTMVANHGTTHSKGVMDLFLRNLNVTINKTLADKNGRYIPLETSIDETNIVVVSTYAPNDSSHQIIFLRDPPSSVLFAYAMKTLCYVAILTALWIPWAREVAGLLTKKIHLTEFESTIRVHSFMDALRIVNLHNISFTWATRRWRYKADLTIFSSQMFCKS